MDTGRNGYELAMLAVVCVLTIFLFPATQGPYSVVNGPVTALQAARAAIRLRSTMMQSAFRSLGTLRIVLFSWMSLPQVESGSTLRSCAAVLRC